MKLVTLTPQGLPPRTVGDALLLNHGEPGQVAMGR